MTRQERPDTDTAIYFSPVHFTFFGFVQLKVDEQYTRRYPFFLACITHLEILYISFTADQRLDAPESPTIHLYNPKGQIFTFAVILTVKILHFTSWLKATRLCEGLNDVIKKDKQCGNVWQAHLELHTPGNDLERSFMPLKTCASRKKGH